MRKHDIAIIGMEGIYPKCKNTDELWKALCEATDLSYEEDLMERSPNYINKCYKIDGIEFFDNELFNYTPHECEVMDPQQRLLLECAYRTLENTGYINGECNNTIGTFVSSSISSYLLNNLLKNRKYNFEEIDYNILLGNDKDFLATRIAYKMNLTGPAVVLQSACSSSLVCLNYAIKSIESGECNMALVGGVSVQIPQGKGYKYKEGGIMSKTGICRPFDEKADGTIKGNGCSVIMIKKLKDALRDNDPIKAVISGIGVNNDGNKKIGFTAPSIEGQQDVIVRCLKDAGITENEVDYIETHGTGTSLGDPIEIKAISQVYKNRERAAKIHIGSIKANIGHMDCAAGITSIIKSVYILNQNLIPAIKNLTKINPSIEKITNKLNYPMENIHTKVNHVGVSSFGLGGTNTHVILSKWSPNAIEKKKISEYILPISYSKNEDLDLLKDNIAELVNCNENFEDIIYSISIGKRRFKNNVSIVFSSKEELLNKLNNNDFIEKPNTKEIEIPSFNKNEFKELYMELSSFKTCCDELTYKLTNQTLSEIDYNNAFRILLEKLGATSNRKVSLIKPKIESEGVILTETTPLKRFMIFLGKVDSLEEIKFKNLYEGLGYEFTKTVNYPMKKKYFFVLPDSEEKSIDIKKTINPDNDLLKGIIEIWEDELGIEKISKDDDYFDLDGNSLLAINIIDQIGKRLNKQLTLQDFMNCSTPTSLCELIRKSNYKNKNISKIKAGNNGLNLFLIHAAGGGTFSYKDLSRYLTSDFTIYSIDLPENYEKYDNFEVIGREYLTQIKEIQLQGKYYIGGHSFGGNLAFEMALQLQKEDCESELIFFDSHTPHSYNQYKSETIDYNKIFTLIEKSYMGENIVSEKNESNLESDRNLKKIKDKNFLNLKISSDEVEVFLRKWIFNHQLLKKYNPTGIFNGNVTLYKATETENSEILEGLKVKNIDKSEWKKYITGKFAKIDVPGNHYTMFSNKENIKKLAKKVDILLSRYELEINK